MGILDKIKFGKPLFDEVCANAKDEESAYSFFHGVYQGV